jgi:outer membrane lipoprotein-sorting protein
MKTLVTTALFLMLPLAASAADPTAQQLLKNYDEVMGPGSFEMSSSMEAHREDGTTRTYKMRVLKAGDDKLRVFFSEPSSARGQEMLRTGENMWQYMPNLKKAVRVPARDSFMGGDFNNADVLRVNYTADYDAVVVASNVPNTWQLELSAKPNVSKEVAYDKIRLWLSKEAKPMPVRAEYYARSGKLLRSAEFSDVKDFDGARRPARVVMKNELATQRYSVMLTEALKIKDVSGSKFVLDDLGR